VGRRLEVVGHGVRERQLLGPPPPGADARAESLVLRRYLCLGCGAVVLVGPCGVLPRKHYSGAAIAWALALCGLLGLPLAEVRRQVSPWRVVGAAAAVGWVSVRRWVAAARRGRLFPSQRRPQPEGSMREAAAALAQELAGHVLPEFRTQPLDAQAFWAAALAG
jgi:hypothetical protein